MASGKSLNHPRGISQSSITPSYAYNPSKKPLSKRDKHRGEVAARKRST